MRNIEIAFLFLVCGSAVFAQRPPEPVLKAAQLPQYPIIARQAHIGGEVKARFTLSPSGEVLSVEALTGPAILQKAAEENIRSWTFFVPEALQQTELTFQTTFRYHFSERRVEWDEVARLIVTVDSFHRVEVMTDLVKPNAN
jgi:TonB family protein